MARTGSQRFGARDAGNVWKHLDHTVSSTCRDRLYVLRLFDNAEWLAEEPDLARHEAAALQKAISTGLPCPEVVAFDEDGSACGMPLLLMTHLLGRVDLQPVDFDDWLHQQAEALVRIHSLDTGDYPWQYFPGSMLTAWGCRRGRRMLTSGRE